MRIVACCGRIVFSLLVFSIMQSGVVFCQNLTHTNLSYTNPFFFRDEMRNFIQTISSYSHQFHPNCIIIPQNGLELLTANGEPEGLPMSDYLMAIHGVGQEELFYGYSDNGEPTPPAITSFWLSFLDTIRTFEKAVLITDYCSNSSQMMDSFEKNASHQFIIFAADHRELNHIPDFPLRPFHENNQNIENILSARNFLYLINPSNFSIKEEMIESLSRTNYDLLIIDPFFSDNEILSPEDISSLKQKSNGGSRLVLSYLSIGEAENYRYYWKKEWDYHPPSWLGEENPDWKGNYTVQYWDREWQRIIVGNPDAYLDKILKIGFDGVYLDKVDSFEYFESIDDSSFQ